MDVTQKNPNNSPNGRETMPNINGREDNLNNGRAGSTDFMPTEKGKIDLFASNIGMNRYWKTGEKILGLYEVIELLGEGGMGVVYRCHDKTGNGNVAVKGLPPEVSHNTSEMREVKANYELVSTFFHQNIANYKTLEVDEKGDYYLVMEYVEGEDLREWMRRMRREKKITLEIVLPILQQIAEALDEAHRHDIIHRDLKPDNVKIKVDGTVKVLDFGLAAQIRTSYAHVSKSIAQAGTNLYKSPEQWRGSTRQGVATDQYSLAVMAYELLSGHVPFESDDTIMLMQIVLTQKPEWIEGLPKNVNETLQKGLAKEASERYASCVDFVRALGGEIIERKIENVFDENKLYALWGQIEEYSRTYEKTEWDRGQTFGSHLESFMNAWRSATAASKFGKLEKAYDFLLMANEEWQWLQRNTLLRDKASQKRKLALSSRHKAETEEAKQYAQKDFQEAVRLLEETTMFFESGRFEDARKGFEDAERLFTSAGKSSLKIKRINELNQKITEAVKAEHLSDARSAHQELRQIDVEMADAWVPDIVELDKKITASVLARKEECIRLLEQRISGKRFAASRKLVGELKQLDESLGEQYEIKIELGEKELITNGVLLSFKGMNMRLKRVEPGSFKNKDLNKKIFIKRGYWIGETVVTQEQFMTVMEENPSKDSKGGTYPVESVSWEDAERYCKTLERLCKDQLPPGYRLDLPTEAQWEHAAHGGNQSKGYEYSGSNRLDDVGWYSDNSNRKHWIIPMDFGLHPVGMKKPNELGLYDMSGNVWEWCRDCYDEEWKYDPETLVGMKERSCRVVRGGGWCNSPLCCRVSHRRSLSPTGRDNNLGFRIAIVPIQ